MLELMIMGACLVILVYGAIKAGEFIGEFI